MNFQSWLNFQSLFFLILKPSHQTIPSTPTLTHPPPLNTHPKNPPAGDSRPILGAGLGYWHTQDPSLSHFGNPTQLTALASVHQPKPARPTQDLRNGGSSDICLIRRYERYPHTNFYDQHAKRDECGLRANTCVGCVCVFGDLRRLVGWWWSTQKVIPKLVGNYWWLFPIRFQSFNCSNFGINNRLRIENDTWAQIQAGLLWAKSLDWANISPRRQPQSKHHFIDVFISLALSNY